MSLYKGTTLLAGVATNTISNAHTLFDFKWTDHTISSMEWTRADTFSWQDGSVYTAAYQHLVADNSAGTSQSETIGSYTITYVLAEDGHKITTDETTVADIYAESGAAWYYVLDTTNQRFKLPRTKYGFTGYRDGVGKYVEAGVPNIEGTLQIEWINGTGAFYKNVTGTSNNKQHASTNSVNGIGFNASLSNSIYGNSTTVQPPATQMYLYFYVGQFSQSATEQTAGLNSELFNGKADIDAENFTNAGKEAIVTLGMPDYSRGVEYTSNTTGTLAYDSKVVCTTSVSNNCYARFAVLDSNNNVIDDVRCYGTQGGIATSASGYFPKGSNYNIVVSNGSSGSVRVLIYPLKGSS